jgi:methionyl-tRNA formyltransferase
MTAPVRVAFLGNDAWSVPPLEALAHAPGIELGMVVTRDPRPGRRGAGPAPTPVAAFAREHRLPLLETPTVRSGPGREGLDAAGASVLAVVAYGELLPPDVLASAPTGAVNLHFSLLPRWRGAAPVQRAILAGDPVTGVTTMLMDAGLDTGPVLERLEEPIRPDDDAGSLGARLAKLGAPLLVASIAGLAAGTVAPRAQEGAPTVAPKLLADDRPLPWSQDAASIVRRVRALSPSPGATATVAGDLVKVLRAEERSGEEGAAAAPGTVVAVEAAGLVVRAGVGAVRLLEVAPPGRRRMSGGDLARGARLAPGDRLG